MPPLTAFRMEDKYQRRSSLSSSSFFHKVGSTVGLTSIAAVVLSSALITFMLMLEQHERVLSVYYNQIENSMLPRNLKASAELDFYSSSSQPAKPEPEGLKLAWLMSFPNSGTSFTSLLIRELSKTDSGSNYAYETDAGRAGFKYPIYEDMPEGPFWVNKAEPGLEYEYTLPTEYVLTKTHCGLRCALCPPEGYAESTYSFRNGCLMTEYLNVNETEGSSEMMIAYYPPDRLTKAIHLIRDPFDNAVSRFHLERHTPGRKAGNYPSSREGFRAYCKSIHNIHNMNKNKVKFLSPELLVLLKQIPCHEDFIKYIEWHNLAFFTTHDLGLETFVLHYDYYHTHYNETAHALMDFLKLPIAKNGVYAPFKKGLIYSEYFTYHEKKTLAEAFKVMSSTETWEHIGPYFEGFHEDVVPDATVPELQRPPLNALVKEGSKTEITGDVQFLMDFAIVGYPKTGTSTKVRWLARQKEIQMYDQEIYHLKDDEPADMVRKLYALPEGNEYKRGYKAPRDIHNPHAIQSFNKYFPYTKFIVGLRHPVLWFESFYNYRIRSNITLPSPLDMIGDCTPEMYNVCTEEIRYMDHLSAMGKTDRTDPEELALLSPVLPRHRLAPMMNNSVFLYEISQMEESDEELAAQYRLDLQNYLDMSKPIEPLDEPKESHEDSPYKDLFIDICDPLYAPVHAELMDIAEKSSIWLRDFFLPLPDVHVSSPDHFITLIEDWLIDPCQVRMGQALVSEV